MLHRSASPANASTADVNGFVLGELGVRTVLDLRGEADATKDAGPRLLLPETQYLPLLTSDMMRHALLGKAAKLGKRSFSQLLALGFAKKLSPSKRLKARLADAVDRRLAALLDTVSLYDLYRLIIDNRRDELRQAAELVATGEEGGALPLLVHCTHGKDRTGVLVALLLYACGVSEEEIISDYVLSHEWGCSVEGKWHARQSLPSSVRERVDQSVLDRWCEAPESVLAQMFAALREEFGSVEGYLDEIGITKDLRQQLASTLTVPA